MTFYPLFSGNYSKRSGALIASLLFVASLAADTHQSGSATFRADAHGPAGISGDHLHKAGEFMVGYMYMDMRMDGLRHGKDEIGFAEVLAEGYTSTATEMTMRMQMGHFMYAPIDRLTLIAMPTYQEMEMTMEVIGMSSGHGHGGHSAAIGTRHVHSTEGWGDTRLGGIFRIWKSGEHNLLGSLLISVPTGSVSVKNADGTFTHYGMQLGSGTWDAIPGLVYTGRHGPISWGAKTTLTLRLEDTNDSGYQLGDVVEATAWTAWSPVSWASLSTRLAYRDQGELTGHYNGPHNHSSPPDLQNNYGGNVLSAGFGLNTVIPSGLLAGQRLGAEVLMPIEQDLNGIQLSRDLSWTVNWSYAF